MFLTCCRYSDLLRWFQLYGYPPKRRYLFLGGIIDQECAESIETLAFLAAYKVCFEIFMLNLLLSREFQIELLQGFEIFSFFKQYFDYLIYQCIGAINIKPLFGLLNKRLLSINQEKTLNNLR